MGNRLALKSDPRYLPQRGTTNVPRLDIDQTERKVVANDLEVETVMLDESGNTSNISGYKPPRYIVRYRSEEERLAHQLEQTQTKLRMAIEQGQKLRAKSNRYEDELKTLKAQQEQAEISDPQWKKKYTDLEKQYRDLKEDFDVLVARNKNGRDFLRQQGETIQVLSGELQKERSDKEELLYGSMSSLSLLSEGGGSKSKKAKRVIQQLEIDKRLLEERVRDLTERNQRGREYLGKLEVEKQQQENVIAELETDLHNAKTDRNELMSRLGMSSSLRLHENPEFIDFSDENRVTNIGERYSQLYDNEWTDAYIELTDECGMVSADAVQILLDMLTITFQHCQSLATSHLDDIEKTLRDFNTTAESLEGREFLAYLKAQRKTKYAYNVESIRQALERQLHQLVPSVEPKPAVKKYIFSIVEFCWLMNVQDPPCTISWDLRKGEPFQSEKYKVFINSGKLVDYIVWPVLYLHQGGGVVCKGVAQAMSEKHEEPEDETIIVTTVMPLSGDEPQPSLKINLDTPVGQKKYEWITENHDTILEEEFAPRRTDALSSTPNVQRPRSYEEVIFKQDNRVHQASLSVQSKQEKENKTLNIRSTTERTVDKNGSAFENLYSVVNKSKREKNFDFLNSNKTSTDVGYAEVELVAEEECITRF